MLAPYKTFSFTWIQRVIYILFISRQYRYLFRDSISQLIHIDTHKTVSLYKIPVWVLKRFNAHINLSGDLIQNFWFHYSHGEIKDIFNLKSSPVLSNQITEFKKLAQNRNNIGITTFAWFLLLVLKDRKSEIISRHLNVLLSSQASNEKSMEKHGHPSLTKIELKDLNPSLTKEVSLALTLVSDEKLLCGVAKYYELLIIAYINSLSDIGRLLAISPEGLTVPKFKDFKDLANKLTRRWKFRYEKEEKVVIPFWLKFFKGRTLDEYTFDLFSNTKEIYSCAISLENCIHMMAKEIKEQKQFFLILKKEQKPSILLELNEDGIIIEIKKKYNEGISEEERLSIQNFIYKTLRETL